jgi:hypothetical protein
MAHVESKTVNSLSNILEIKDSELKEQLSIIKVVDR